MATVEKVVQEVESTPEQKRLSYYLRSLCRQVTDVNPEGFYSQRELSRRTKINATSLRDYEAGTVDPAKIDDRTLEALARFKGWSLFELKSFIQGHPPEQRMDVDMIVSAIRWNLSMTELSQVVHALAERLESNPQHYPAPVATNPNQKILEALADRQKQLGLDDTRWGKFLELFALDLDDIESLTQGNTLTEDVLPGLLGVLDISEDELIDLLKPGE